MPDHLISYDYLQVFGGAENVTLKLWKSIPQAHLMVSGVSQEFRNQSAESFGIEPDDRKLPHHRLLRILSSIYFFAITARKQVKNTKKSILFSGAFSPLAVFHSPRDVKKIYYCHTPPRFVFDKKRYFEQKIPIAIRPLYLLFIKLYKSAYIQAIKRMDVVLCNSKNVQKRLCDATGVQAQVLYPGVDCDNYSWKESQDYFISNARLEPLKRVSLIIQAFKEMPDKKLVVCSGGSEYQSLKALAAGHNNIRFTSWVSDTQLKNLTEESTACIYLAEDEDFGMSPVEAMSAGKPVIAAASGGLVETVLHEKTGFLIEEPIEIPKIKQFVYAMSKERAYSMKSCCEQRAQEFSSSQFIKKMQNIICEPNDEVNNL